MRLQGGLARPDGLPTLPSRPKLTAFRRSRCFVASLKLGPCAVTGTQATDILPPLQAPARFAVIGVADMDDGVVKAKRIVAKVERSRARILVEQARELAKTSRQLLEESHRLVARAQRIKRGS